MTPAGEVAQVILTAATDGSDQLRYLVGHDTRGFIRAWDTLPCRLCLLHARALRGHLSGLLERDTACRRERANVAACCDNVFVTKD
jgi:hypothetical protein